ncbi:MAG: ethylbenzene dehydrogenase-related protein [Geminicoccaceae bacterium]
MTNSAPKPRADLCTFVLHWLLVICVLVSLLTGLRIAADYHASIAGSMSSGLGWLLPEGPVITWHVWSSWLLVFVAFAYAAFLWWSRESIRVKLDRSVRQRLVRAWTSGRFWHDLPAWFAINVVIYQIAFVLIGLMALTGWMLYAGVSLGLGHDVISTIHGLFAYTFIAYIVIHILAQLKSGAFWKIFRPGMRHAAAAAVALLAAGAIVGAAYFIDRSQFDELLIAKVDEAPKLDGSGDDGAWSHVETRTIQTHRGANLPDGEVAVEVAAVHDGERVYFRFRWADPQRSRKHLPLIKEAGGWRVLQSEFEINDEDDYYEDKFAVAISTEPELGSGTVHLGQNLIDGPHRDTTRGLHYTADGSLVDMWHWKSVRTGSMSPALMDDNQFGPPKASEKDGARYTAGYTQDPKETGGYSLNWTKLDESKPLNDVYVQPKFLPADQDLLQTIEQIDLDPKAPDKGIWHLTGDDVVPFDPKADDLPIGTVLPSVVVEGSFAGDRGDVRAGADWQDGRWTLEVSRLLDTGSEHDVALSPERDSYLWVAVFNHTQTRHSQHLHPLRLKLR